MKNSPQWKWAIAKPEHLVSNPHNLKSAKLRKMPILRGLEDIFQRDQNADVWLFSDKQIFDGYRRHHLSEFDIERMENLGVCKKVMA